MRAPLLPGLLLLAACTSGGGDVVSSEPTRLSVELVAAPGQAPQRWTLTCDPAGGDHPDPEGACRDLAAADDPFAPLPADAMCTEIYGGPQTAVVEGTWRGEPVRLELSRTDGCRIAQWDALGAVLPPV